MQCYPQCYSLVSFAVFVVLNFLQILEILPGHSFCVALSSEVSVGLVTKRDCLLRFIIEPLSGPFLGSRRVGPLNMYCSACYRISTKIFDILLP